MDDKNPRLGPRPDEELLGGRANEQVTGRAGAASEGSPAREYPGQNITGDPGTDTRVHTSRPGATRPPESSNAARTSARSEDYDEDEADPEAAARARQIRADITRTRSNMSETVDAIQDRLSPSNIASNAAETVRNAASDTARQVAESDSVQYVRSNPIPSAMVAVGVGGLAWLLFGRTESPKRYSRRARGARGSWRRPDYDWSDYEDRIYSTDRSELTGRYQAGTRHEGRTSSYDDRYRSGVAETGRDLTSKASDMADDAQRRARQMTRRARSGMRRTWDRNPLLVGAAALVAGAIIGAAVPETERENEWLGETRDDVVEGVQQSVRDTVGKVQDAASAAVGLAGGNATSDQNEKQGAKPSSGQKGGNT